MRIESTAALDGWIFSLVRSFTSPDRSTGAAVAMAMAAKQDKVQVVFDCSQKRRFAPFRSARGIGGTVQIARKNGLNKLQTERHEHLQQREGLSVHSWCS